MRCNAPAHVADMAMGRSHVRKHFRPADAVTRWLSMALRFASQARLWDNGRHPFPVRIFEEPIGRQQVCEVGDVVIQHAKRNR